MLLLLLRLLHGWGPHHVVGNRRGQRSGRVQGLGLQLQMLGDALAVDVATFRFVAPILEPNLHLGGRQVKLLRDYLALRTRQILFESKATLQLQDLCLGKEHARLSLHPGLGGTTVAPRIAVPTDAVFSQLGTRGGHLAVIL